MRGKFTAVLSISLATLCGCVSTSALAPMEPAEPSRGRAVRVTQENGPHGPRYVVCGGDFMPCAAPTPKTLAAALEIGNLLGRVRRAPAPVQMAQLDRQRHSDLSEAPLLESPAAPVLRGTIEDVPQLRSAQATVALAAQTTADIASEPEIGATSVTLTVRPPEFEPESVGVHHAAVQGSQEAKLTPPTGAVPPAPGRIVVRFEFDRAELTPGSRAALDQFVDGAGPVPLAIEGYTDAIGTPEYNSRLARRRASTVQEYLIQRGVDPSRIGIEAPGACCYVASNDTPEGRATNRRAEVVVALTHSTITTEEVLHDRAIHP